MHKNIVKEKKIAFKLTMLRNMIMRLATELDYYVRFVTNMH